MERRMTFTLICPNCKKHKFMEIPDEVFMVWPEFDVTNSLYAACRCGGVVQIYIAEFEYKEKTLCLKL
jgi:hypothetical protein